jgi:phosphoglucosamine mutase
MSSSQATDPRDRLAHRLTPETALQFGKLAGSERRTVVITSDRNPSALMMEQAVVAGVISIGGTAYTIDDTPAPAVPFCDIPYNYHINISSISPNSMCGMEIFNSKGAYISAMDVFNMTYREMGLKYPDYTALGTAHRMGKGPRLSYAETLQGKIQDCNCQVVLDATYYRHSKLTAKLLESLNTDVVLVKRPSNRYLPAMGETDLQDLARTQKSYKGSIGLAINSDGTKVAAFDNVGRYITSAQIGMIFAVSMNLRKVTVPIDTTMALDEVIRANGGVVVRAASSFRSAVDAGVANGSDMIMDEDGHFVFPDTTYMADGIHAAGKLAEINGKTKLADFVDEMETFHRQTASVRTQANKNDLLGNIRRIVEEEGYDYIDTGAVRIEFDDGCIILRVEEADDSVTISCEGRDKAYAISLLDIAKGMVDECIRRCN